MRNILLIGINSKYTHSNLAIRYMAAYAGLPIFECTINDDIFSVYRKLLARKEDYFCFSVYIWNVEFTVKLCQMLHTARPEIKIIFGGPEAGYDKENLFFQHSWLFGCCTGEGEEFALQLKNTENLSEIPNFSYRTENGTAENPLKKNDLSKLKFPYTQSDVADDLKNRILYFESSRGCLFNCAYCLSSSEGKTRFFPMDYVKNGLLFFMENQVSLVKFVDRTFNESNERACEIVSFILEHNRNTRFHFEIAPQLLTEEFVALCAQKPEFFQFEMGIQTTNPETMRAIHRPYDTEKTAEKIRMIPRSIHQHLDLIAGLPYETFDSFKSGFNFVYSLYPHMLQVGFLKVLKHTAMQKVAEQFNIQTTAFPPYEVLYTGTMPADVLIKLKKLENAVDRIYNSGIFTETLNVLDISDPFDFYLALGEQLYAEEYNAPLSRSGLYEFMYKAFPNMKKSLTIDFLKNNRKAALPSCFADDSSQVKRLHKILSKLPQFSQIKFRLVFAAGCIFAVTEHEISDVTQLAQGLLC